MAKFFNIKFWLLTCSSVFAHTALAQQPDTTRHQLRTVEIFGKPAEVYAAGSRVAHLDSSYLHTYASGSLAEALQARTPIYFKSYGVSGISTVTFRGTNASQTAVLWNGLNISSPILGQTDFSILPANSFGNVAIQYGSAGATYGSGAIGGAVLLNSPDYTGKGLGAELKTEVGSFGTYFGNGTLHYGIDRLQVGASIFHKQAANNFKYKDVSKYGAPEVRQQNAALVQQGFTQDLVWQLNPQTKIGLHSWYTSTGREVQPATGSAANDARQQDNSLRVMAELLHNSSWGTSEVKAGYFNDYLQYTNTSVNSVADINTYQLQAEQTYAKGLLWNLRGGINIQHYSAENDGYTGTKKENRASAFALLRYNPTPALKLSINLRQAMAEGYNPKPTPALGAEWKFFNNNQNQLSVKGNTSGSYRLPTLNDRFWIGAGNPNLRPEQGWNYEAGLHHIAVKGNTFLLDSEISAYYLLVDNWIQWSPDQNGRWRAINLQKVISKGLEASTKATTKIGQFTLISSVGYTLTSAVQADVYEGTGDKGKQLMYVPKHKAILSSDLGYKGWALNSSLNFTGLRYTSNSESNYLDGFLLLNLAINKKLTLGANTFILGLRSDNVTNTEYQTMAFRAMPPRGYTFSLRLIIP